MKISKFEGAEDGDWVFFCPGCHHSHIIDKRWTFDGNFDNPTFTPSLLNTYKWPDELENRCHLFIRNGKIEYCSDSTHPLSGKTVEMIEMKE